MTEYINREELRKHLKECYDNELFDADMRKVTFGIDVYVENMPTADIQPVDRWISVKDKLPETNAIGIAHILAYDKYEGVVKADFLDESANYIGGSNIFQISNTSTQLYKVTHWQPLPEPPKEG